MNKKKARRLYRTWVKYLKDSRLSEDEVHSRARKFTKKVQKP